MIKLSSYFHNYHQNNSDTYEKDRNDRRTITGALSDYYGPFEDRPHRYQVDVAARHQPGSYCIYLC